MTGAELEADELPVGPGDEHTTGHVLGCSSTYVDLVSGVDSGVWCIHVAGHPGLHLGAWDDTHMAEWG